MSEHLASMDGLKQRAIAIVLAATAVSTCVLGTSSDTEPVQAETTCIQPTEQDFHDVDILLSQPSPTPDLTYYTGRKDAVYAKERRALGRILGLTIPEPLASTSNDPTAILEETSRMAANYGITIEVEQTDPSITPTPAELNSSEMAASLLFIQQSLLSRPTEITEAGNVHKIDLYASKPDARNWISLGYVQPQNHDDTLHLDIMHAALSANTRTPEHETWHMIDANMCGPEGMSHDPDYTELNTTSDLYTNNNQNSLAQSDEQYQMSTIEALGSSGDSPYAQQCGIDANAGLTDEGYAVQVESSYGKKDPAEDKAELGKLILEPQQYSTIFDKHKPTLYRKARLLLARLYHINRPLATYLALTGTRPDVCTQNEAELVGGPS